jgi:hypothetical protein
MDVGATNGWRSTTSSRAELIERISAELPLEPRGELPRRGREALALHGRQR